jgi:rfaE bifunctional protein nucleotidyltransferase chain/domain
MKQKIINLEKLDHFLKQYRKVGKKVVLCHGVFDLLHIGHIKHFEEAKNFGDILVVSLTPDIYVNKGPGRPAFNEKLRLQAVAALHMVNHVVLNLTPTAVNLIKKIKPNFYCKGPDYKNYQNDVSGEIKNEMNAIKKVGGKIVYTDDGTFSSSKLINQNEADSDLNKIAIKKIKKSIIFFNFFNCYFVKI